MRMIVGATAELSVVDRVSMLLPHLRDGMEQECAGETRKAAHGFREEMDQTQPGCVKRREFVRSFTVKYRRNYATQCL